MILWFVPCFDVRRGILVHKCGDERIHVSTTAVDLPTFKQIVTEIMGKIHYNVGIQNVNHRGIWK